MKVKHFFDSNTNTLTYIVYDEKTKDAVIIDPVLNYDLASNTYLTTQIETVTNFIKANKLHLYFILETHVHADHLTSSKQLKKIFANAKSAIGQGVVAVQKIFKPILELPQNFATDGSQFDQLIADDEVFTAGSLSIKALRTKGHTESCVSYLINNEAVFTGDALFMPDYGTGRCDFPGGSAKSLFHSIKEKLYSLSDDIKVFVGHDYMPNGRELKFQTTIGEEKASNVHLKHKTSEAEFISLRETRDKSLNKPKLLDISVVANLAAGK